MARPFYASKLISLLERGLICMRPLFLLSQDSSPAFRETLPIFNRTVKNVLTKLGRSAIILSSLMVERTLLQSFASTNGDHYHVAVAQWIERFPAEEEVGGSNPLSNAFFIFGF
jgi:hypothetical protein